MPPHHSLPKTLKLTELWRYQLPLALPLPLKNGVLEMREGLLLAVQDQAGQGNWVEVAPLPGWSSESLEQCLSWLLAHKNNLSLTQTPALPSVSWGLYLAQAHLPQPGNRLRLNALLTAAEPGQLEQEASALSELGYRTVKLKVGRFDPQQEHARIAAVLKGLGGLGQLRLDANRSWTLGQALALVEICEDLQLESCLDYIEEPLQAIEDLPAFSQACHWPVALDESLGHSTISPAIWQACSAVVLKPMLLGAAATLNWLTQAQFSGKKITISSLFESPWGLAKLAFWAAQVAPDQAAGLDTWRSFAPQPELPPWEIAQGQLILTQKMLDTPPLNTVYLKKMII